MSAPKIPHTAEQLAMPPPGKGHHRQRPPLTDLNGDVVDRTPWEQRLATGWTDPRSPERTKEIQRLHPRVEGPEGPIMPAPDNDNQRLKLAAQRYTEAALAMLAHIAENGKSEPARVAAIKELLDRGYGKPGIGMEVRPQHATKIQVLFGAGSQTVEGASVETIDEPFDE